MKKLISIMLVLAMLISVCVVPAMAEESAVVASVDGSDFMSFADAMAAAKDGSTVELYKPVILEEQLVIEKAITINGNGNTISSSTVQRMIWIKSDVTINDLTVENTKAAGRCIETRAGGLTLNLNNVTLNTTATTGGNTQALTVGGNAGTKENRVKVNLIGCNINGGTKGYGIITFNPTDLLIKNTSAVCGYGAIYLKPADGSVGSAGTVVTVVNSNLTSDATLDSASFGTIVIESNDITVNVDADSTVVATSGEDAQYAVVFSSWIQTSPEYVDGADYTGLDLTIQGEIDTDYYVCNLINTKNKIAISNSYKSAVEAEGHVAVDLGNGMISVWADHEHTYTNTVGELHLESAANCTDAAVYYESCSICGLNGAKTFTDGTENGHDWDEGKVTIAPTCTSTGVKTYTCQLASCGLTKTETMAIVPHTLKKEEAKAPTCTEDGNIEYYACTCGAMFNNAKAKRNCYFRDRITCPRS